MKELYTIIYLKERTSMVCTDRSQVAKTLGIHANTVKYRLQSGYYQSDDIILVKSPFYRSERGKK